MFHVVVALVVVIGIDKLDKDVLQGALRHSVVLHVQGRVVLQFLQATEASSKTQAGDIGNFKAHKAAVAFGNTAVRKSLQDFIDHMVDVGLCGAAVAEQRGLRRSRVALPRNPGPTSPAARQRAPGRGA